MLEKLQNIGKIENTKLNIKSYNKKKLWFILNSIYYSLHA